MTGDEYMTLLLQRQDAWRAANPGTRLPPLLEWFIRPGDEDRFTPPKPTPRAPKPPTRPRVYRTAASLTAERDHLQQQADALTGTPINDRAAAGGCGIGIRQAARVQTQQDNQLRRYAALLRRIDSLNQRIRRAQAREASTDPATRRVSSSKEQP